jgi:hypothetical protein
MLPYSGSADLPAMRRHDAFAHTWVGNHFNIQPSNMLDMCQQFAQTTIVEYVAGGAPFYHKT